MLVVEHYFGMWGHKNGFWLDKHKKICYNSDNMKAKMDLYGEEIIDSSLEKKRKHSNAIALKSYRKKIANMTPEEIAEKKRKKSEYDKEYKEKNKEKKKEQLKSKLNNMTPEEIAEKKRKKSEYDKARKARIKEAETSEQREVRLASMRYENMDPEDVKADRKRRGTNERRAKALKAKKFRRDNMTPEELAEEKEIQNAKQREWYHDPKNHRTRRGYYLKKEYGITIDDYERMYEEQNHKCKSCNVDIEQDGKFTHVDHDHRYEKRDPNGVMGILCHACNTSRGQLGNDVQRMRGLMEYQQWIDEKFLLEKKGN